MKWQTELSLEVGHGWMQQLNAHVFFHATRINTAVQPCIGLMMPSVHLFHRFPTCHKIPAFLIPQASTSSTSGIVRRWRAFSRFWFSVNFRSCIFYLLKYADRRQPKESGRGARHQRTLTTDKSDAAYFSAAACHRSSGAGKHRTRVNL